MDSIQTIIVEAIEQSRDCLTSRMTLKNLLSDVIPSYKLQMNLVLNAYDEGIMSKLKSSLDSTLTALHLVKELSDTYGIDSAKAIWSISTWCFIMKMDQIASALSTLTTSLVEPTNPLNEKKAPDSNIQSPTTTTYEFYSTYKAGLDFPVGELLIVLDGTMKEGYIAIDAGKNPKKLERITETRKQAYIRVNDGEFIYLRPYNNFKWNPPFSTYTITKI